MGSGVKSKSDLAVIFSFLILFISVPFAIFGRIISNFLYILGQIMELMGAVGIGIALIGIGLLIFLHPRPFTKWMIIPPSEVVLRFVVRPLGILLSLVAVLIIFEGVWDFLQNIL